MRDLLRAAKLLLLDLASAIVFLIAYVVSKNIPLSVAIGMALGVVQISVQFARKKPIETMVCHVQAERDLHNCRCRDAETRMDQRYLPPLANAVVPDIAIIVSFLWACLMFASAIMNAFVALNCSVVTWAWFMPLFGIVSKIALLLISFGAMRMIGRRRYAAMPDSEREGLTAAA